MTEQYQDIIPELSEFIRIGLEEDVGEGDHTSRACVPEDDTSRARLLVKERCVFSGLPVAEAMARYVDPQAVLEPVIREGEEVKPGDVAFYLEMNSRALLMIERLMLNTLQRMCGIATMSRKYADAVREYEVEILDTRKTTPHMRLLEKWAVKTGGCTNYRMGLYDRIMIKDNHVDAAGSMENALHEVHRYLRENHLDLQVTVEVRDFEELNTVLQIGGFERIMLDNFTVGEMREAVALIDGRHETEASGGITYDDLRQVAESGVDYISVGALTHGVTAVDLSLKVV